MSYNRRNNKSRLTIYWTEEEREEIINLFNATNESKQRQSEMFAEFIIKGLKNYRRKKNELY